MVSVMGPYRTGKSFLLNRLLPSKDARERKPFQIGDAVHPETEEVAMYIFPPCADPALEVRDTTALDLLTSRQQPRPIPSPLPLLVSLPHACRAAAWYFWTARACLRRTAPVYSTRSCWLC